jgi:hypothetical protein
MTKLVLFNVGDNQLSGTIRTEMGNPGHMSELDLYKNLLTGEIPTELANLTSLQSLTLFNNSFTGGANNICPNSPFDGGYLSGGVSEIECECCTGCCSDMDDDTCT